MYHRHGVGTAIAVGVVATVRLVSCIFLYVIFYGFVEPLIGLLCLPFVPAHFGVVPARVWCRGCRVSARPSVPPVLFRSLASFGCLPVPSLSTDSRERIVKHISNE